jgi:hypothetical protein
MFRATTAAAVLSVGLMAATATAANPPFGGDDTGFIPVPKSDIAKCEAKTSKAVSKLISCIIKCHDSRASGKLADDTAEDMCEAGLSSPKPTCKAAFAAAIAKLTGCPACINKTSMETLANTVETLLDANNGSVYCATSPSGAFLQ